jgi:hypothetical protein
MKRYTLIGLIIITNLSVIIGQWQDGLQNDISKVKNELPKNIKKIIQYSDTIILNVREYDKNSNEIFNYYVQYVGEFWNGKNVYLISGKFYDSQNRLIKSYNLHSNIGFSISIFEYDSINNVKTEFLIEPKNIIQHEANSNPYRYIAKICSINDLLEFKEIIELEQKSKRQLIKKEYYDNSDKLLKTVVFDERLDTSSTSFYFYNKIGKLISISQNLNPDLPYRYHSYEKKYNYTEDNRIIYTETGIEMMNSSNIINLPTKKIDTIETKIYEYNSINQLINEYSLMSDYEFMGNREYEYDKTSYKYNESGLIIEKVNSRTYPKNKFLPNEGEELFSSEKYKYNETGYVIEEKTYEFQENKEKQQLYKYEFEYYDHIK